MRAVGFRMAGYMLSGRGIRVFVLGNVEFGWGGWGKIQTMGDGVGVAGMGCGGGWGGGVCWYFRKRHNVRPLVPSIYK